MSSSKGGRHKDEDAIGRDERQGTKFLRYFGPVLDALRSLGDSGTPDEVIEQIVRDLHVPEATLNEQLPSGESRFRNQVHFARFYLAKEGLIDSSQRGVWTLTERGRSEHLDYRKAKDIFDRWVRIFDERRRQRGPALIGSGDGTSAESASGEGSTGSAAGTNEEPIAPDPDQGEEPGERPDYRTQLLATIRSLPPSGFERLSQRILRESGFSYVEVTGRSGDQGIDGEGTLRLNPLVSIKVLFQCKRYAGSVTPAQIRDFRGAMQGRADKGLVITTGSFTASAQKEASRDGVPAIELIDGSRLVKMLEDLGLGLRPRQTFEVDERFFDDFRSP
jgi:restriction system protein